MGESIILAIIGFIYPITLAATTQSDIETKLLARSGVIFFTSEFVGIYHVCTCVESMSNIVYKKPSYLLHSR